MGASQEAAAGETPAEILQDSHFGDAGPARDPLYLFACMVTWHHDGDVNAYYEVVAALDDRDPEIRKLAEHLLHRPSPRPAPKLNNAVGGAW